ncbi:MAG: TonB-dependent receptor [Thermaurantiacus sp.]
MNMPRHLCCGAALAAIAIGGAPAIAQDTQAQAPAASELQDIIVQATRRETDLQRTPIAVTAVGEALIQQSSPRDIGDLSVFVPNFSAAKITGFNAASFAMRGVGQNNIIVYFEPSVAVLIDDFVMPSVQTQLLDTFDVAQVEVLRGPQGTLFGKNTTGGAVVVRTKRPDLRANDLEAQIRAGDFGTVQARAAANAVLVPDTLALRIVAGYDYSEGFMRNGACFGPVVAFVESKFAGVQGCGAGERAGGENILFARAKLLWEPSASFSAHLQYEYLRDSSESPVTVNDTPPNDPAFLFNLLGVGATPGNLKPWQVGGTTKRNGPLIAVGRGHRIDVDGVYLNMDLNIGAGTFTSVTGWRRQKSRLGNTYPGTAPVAADGDVLSLFDANRDDDRETWQQEIRFASDFGGPVDIVAGGFHQQDDVDFCVSQLLGFLDLASGPLPFGSWNDTPYLLCNAQKARSTAVFAELTWKATDRLTVTAGGRYTWERKTWRGRQQAFAQELTGGFDPAFVWQNLSQPLDASVYKFPANVVEVRDRAEEPTWRISLSYEANPDLFLYASYSRGFKAGAFNDQTGGFAPFGTDLEAFAEAARATRPELADSFEAGFKWTTLDRRARLNLTGFWVDYSDMQRQIVVPIEVNGQPNQVTTFFNAASARVKGIEAEATVLPFDGFSLRGVLGFQDAKYREFVTPVPAGYDLASAPLDRAPRWQWSLNASWDVPVSDDLKLVLNGGANYVARNLFTQSIDDPSDNTFLNARTLFDASVTLAAADDAWFIRGVGRNLSNKVYNVASQTVGGLWTFSLYGPPRYFGLEAGFRLGQRR